MKKVPRETWIIHTHMLCDCEAISYLRFRHLGHYFMETCNYRDAPVSKILQFIRSVGLLEGWNRGECTIDLERSRCKGRSEPYPLCIHSTVTLKSLTLTPGWEQKMVWAVSGPRSLVLHPWSTNKHTHTHCPCPKPQIIRAFASTQKLHNDVFISYVISPIIFYVMN
jgi:hypothetical protein